MHGVSAPEAVNVRWLARHARAAENPSTERHAFRRFGHDDTPGICRSPSISPQCCNALQFRSIRCFRIGLYCYEKECARNPKRQHEHLQDSNIIQRCFRLLCTMIADSSKRYHVTTHVLEPYDFMPKSLSKNENGHM